MHRRRPHANGRGADEAVTEMAMLDDAAIIDLDERTQLVRLAEAIVAAQRLQILDGHRWWRVVMGEANLEG